MSADQTPTRQPAFVTQRDGSALANSNCRMASICMGLDHHSGGTKKSTGSKMRSYTSDQSGGTDSGDAKEAWYDGYEQSLTIRDGKTFNDALEDLRAGKVVHLDVWHATVGSSVCLSGSGAYGHTMAVLPDCKSGKWLVGDPWCTSGYKRVSESNLRAGAEEWGRRVYGASRMELDWATAGPDLRQVILNRIVARFMSISYPTHVRELPDFPPETGGAQSILFTVTTSKPLEGDDMGTTFELGDSAPIGLATTTAAVGLIPTQGGEFHPLAIGTKRNVWAVVTISDGPYIGDTAYLCQIPSGNDETGLLLAAAADYVPNEPGGGGNNEERDEEWREWLLAGSPGSD